MNIVSYLFEPVVFFGVLASLFVLSMRAIFYFIHQNEKLNRQILKNSEEDKMRISNLETLLRQKDEEFKKHILAEQTKLKEMDELKLKLSKLEAQLKEKEDSLKKEIYVKEGLSKKVKELEDELVKSKRELVLSNQMYEGLKGQYDELERNTEKLTQRLEERQSQSKEETKVEQLLKLEELTRSEESAQEEKSQPSSEDNSLGNDLELS